MTTRRSTGRRTARLRFCGLTLLFGGALLCGCTKEDAAPEGGGLTTVNFRGSIQTRTAIGADGETVWAAGDRVGIYMVTAGGAIPDNISSGGDNKAYTIDPATGALTPADGTPLYYPSTGAVDFVAYYPHGTAGTEAGNVTADGRYRVSVVDQSDPTVLDVLYAKTEGITSVLPHVLLSFRHLMSKVTLDVALGEGLTALAGSDATALTFSGMPASAAIALQDGTFAAGTAADFSALKAEGATAPAVAAFTAVIVPQAGMPGRKAVFTVDGKSYEWTIPDTEVFEGGKHYVYPVTVKKTGVAVGAPAIADWTTDDHGTGTAQKMEVVRIKAGTFRMGSPDTDPQATGYEKPRHWVKLTRDFYLSKYEVTRTQYAAFLNATGVPKADVGQSAKAEVDGVEQNLFKVNEKGWTPQWNDATGKWEATGDYPMIHVTWYGAKAYAEWVGGRLPTEAEWEYACRAGTETIYSFGDDASLVGDYTVYWYNKTDDGPSEVGTKKPNPWGLYDMHGNVYEWCLDSSDTQPNYPTAATEADAVIDPLVTTGPDRVARGGSWGSTPSNLPSARRNNDIPGTFSIFNGFRVAFPKK